MRDAWSSLTARAILAFALGALAWKHSWLMVFFAFFPAIVLHGQPLRHVFVVAMAYYVGLSMPEATNAVVSYYRASYWISASAWLAHQILLSLGWVAAVAMANIARVPAVWRSSAAFLAGGILHTLPPLGYASWGHPFFAAGFIFPGFGWLGLIAFVLLAGQLPVVWSRARSAIVFLSVLTPVVAYSSIEHAPTYFKDAIVFNTYDGQYVVSDGLTRLNRLKEAASILLEDRHAKIGVMPEGYIGIYRSSVDAAMFGLEKRLAAEGKTLVVGAMLSSDDRAYNGLIGYGSSNGVLYRANVVQPLAALGFGHSMKEGVSEDSGVPVIANKKVLYALCWETWLYSKAIDVLLKRPDALIAASNLWMVPADGNGYFVQKTSLDGIAMLTGIEVYWAKNLGSPYHERTN